MTGRVVKDCLDEGFCNAVVGVRDETRSQEVWIDPFGHLRLDSRGGISASAAHSPRTVQFQLQLHWPSRY
jgi:hypothetical protein